MKWYYDLALASAVALGSCDNAALQEPPRNILPSITQKQSSHIEKFEVIQHLNSSNIPLIESKFTAVICGEPENSAGALNFKYLSTKSSLSFYHVFPQDGLAKSLQLQEGQTVIYHPNGQEICRINSTNSEAIGLEPGYHLGATDIPPEACKDALRAGKKAPDFEYAIFGNDKRISLRGLEGKIVLIDIGATWCGPCMELKPYLEQLEAKYPEIESIWLSVDENAEDLKKYLANNKVGFDHVVNDPHYRESPIIKAYQTVGIPQVYLIDQNGIIAARNDLWDNQNKRFTTVKLEAKIKELLEKK